MTARMSRPTCYQCFWPKALCWCTSIRPMDTRTKFLYLMHPKEFKREKAGTGRLAHLCLANSEIHMGVGFDDHAAVQRLINDSSYFPVLVYPGATARNLSKGDLVASDLGERRLLVLLLDATWIGSRKNASSQSKPAASTASDVQRWSSEPLCYQATASNWLPLHARSNARIAGCTGAFRTGSVPRPGSVARAV